MKIRKEVLEFRPYRVLEGNYKIWLDKNENPFDLPLWLKEEIFWKLRGLHFNRYPHITSMPLREALAEFLGLDSSNIAVGNGSDELINYLVRMFEGKYIVTTPPTFGMYSFYSKLYGIPIVEVPLDENFRIRGDEIAEKAKDALAVFIASPNNPTGNLQPEEEILKVLETGAPVVLDEAYVEFAGKSMLDYVGDYPNLIILRTFSKAFGLASIRAGYMIADSSVVDALYRIKSPFSVSSVTMAIAQTLLEHYEVVEERVKFIMKERERMYEELMPYAYPSDANFLLVKLDAYNYLLDRGIVVRKLSGRLQGHIRITVGKREENDEVIKALKEFAKEL
ncbi:histidinol-phosphate aminotransferase [Thermococcus chitonophagus]|uniref:Histidinol-phosphate aminotransferase n=1 Tax=Thermococcus chitonophagus TaxID=54262 RepID=A0A161K9T5_9EURY|nr:histidinol-phosphate transaminase [Thermococcus chitonophagus]ASJ16243.1 histidinol-phosphate aminotransferase [Thermococcus chitonophagus]CUX78778.1 Histidinol-phosphate aminotransferase [Thermococcus chitonophagus]